MNDAARTRLRPAALAWLGAGLCALGVGLYLLLLHVPWVRSTGLPAFAGAVLGSALALWALRRSRASAVLLPTLLCWALALTIAWLFFWVATLPDARGFAQLVSAPSVRVPQGAGAEAAALEDLTRRGPVWLVFFRGHW